jgi:hypothetical protein
MTFIASSPWLVDLDIGQRRHQWRVCLNDAAIPADPTITWEKIFASHRKKRLAAGLSATRWRAPLLSEAVISTVNRNKSFQL